MPTPKSSTPAEPTSSTPAGVIQAYNDYYLAADKPGSDRISYRLAHNVLYLISLLEEEDMQNTALQENVYPNFETIEKAANKAGVGTKHSQMINEENLSKIMAEYKNTIDNQKSAENGLAMLQNFFLKITQTIANIFKSIMKAFSPEQIAPEAEIEKKGANVPDEITYVEGAKMLKNKVAGVEDQQPGATDDMTKKVKEGKKSVLKRLNSARKGFENIVGTRTKGAGKDKENKDTNVVDNTRKNR